MSFIIIKRKLQLQCNIKNQKSKRTSHENTAKKIDLSQFKQPLKTKQDDSIKDTKQPETT